MRKIIIYKAHKCLLRSWTQDTHCQTGRGGGQLLTQATSCRRNPHRFRFRFSVRRACQLRRGRWNYDNARAARHTGGREGWGDNCGLSVAASSSASGPVSACPRRICIGIGLALVVQVRVYLAYDALYTPKQRLPPPLPLSVFLSIATTY